MHSVHTARSQADLVSLQAAEVTARSGFACLFSTSDEYENALISVRRAEGRYAAPRRPVWPGALAVTCGVTIIVAAMLLLR